MMTRKLRVAVPAFLVLLALVLAGSLGAVNAKQSNAQGEVHTEAAEKFTAVPNTFLDVGAVCDPLTAKWNKEKGLKEKGGTKFGLILEKGCTTETAASADADIEGENGIVLTQLGFDYKTGGHCTTGAPRFNVFTEFPSVFYVVGCLNGTQTDLGNGWTRVRFQEDDFEGGAEPFSYSNTVVDEIEIALDEQGRVVLDNIAINSYQIAKK
jgi:hypothetical protein